MLCLCILVLYFFDCLGGHLFYIFEKGYDVSVYDGAVRHHDAAFAMYPLALVLIEAGKLEQAKKLFQAGYSFFTKQTFLVTE